MIPFFVLDYKKKNKKNYSGVHPRVSTLIRPSFQKRKNCNIPQYLNLPAYTYTQLTTEKDVLEMQKAKAARESQAKVQQPLPSLSPFWQRKQISPLFFMSHIINWPYNDSVALHLSLCTSMPDARCPMLDVPTQHYHLWVMLHS